MRRIRAVILSFVFIMESGSPGDLGRAVNIIHINGITDGRIVRQDLQVRSFYGLVKLLTWVISQYNQLKCNKKVKHICNDLLQMNPH